MYTIHLNIKCYLQMYAILFASLFVWFCSALLKPGFHQDIYAFWKSSLIHYVETGHKI